MDKRYNPTEVEEKWVEIWSNEVVSNESSKESFSQVIPCLLYTSDAADDP